MSRLLAFMVSGVAVVACSSGNGQQADSSVPTGTKLTLAWGPVNVPPGQEGTQCIWLKLPTSGAIPVNQIHNTLSPTSHHLIVYKDDMHTTEQTTPVDCQPFTGALNASGMIAPIAITQTHDDTIALPDGVAYTMSAGQMVKIEMHYINSTDAMATAEATVDLFAADPATIKNEAGVLFAGTPDIDIAAGAVRSVHAFLPLPAALDLSAAHVFAITGHTHRFGTDVQVSVAASPTGPMTSVYAPKPFVWSEPLTQAQNPPFSVPVGGGFDFTCTYHNTNTNGQSVKFGESANDEMCFFWAYYWPSQGSRVCFHTDQYGGHDVCCPGDAICGLIEGLITQ